MERWDRRTRALPESQPFYRRAHRDSHEEWVKEGTETSELDGRKWNRSPGYKYLRFKLTWTTRDPGMRPRGLMSGEVFS